MIVVTGSSGRVGGRVVEALLARGETVRGVDLRASGRSASGFTEAVAPFDDAAAMRAALAGARAVLHLGAFMSWRPTDDAQLFASNVEGTRAIV
ncbi:MAG: NAD-dependent epimerase/dehydratase family protein, partial [Beijerinckiaceae bacterium]